ncbi:hypothetical protein [Candidatus Thiosymbion oneisti]|nr:hypothetical protein [Candidatus Thiosymbion oneisti]
MRTELLTPALWWETTRSLTLRYFHGTLLLVIVLFLGLSLVQ